MHRILLSLIVCASLALSSCGLSPAEAGFGGAAVGAGTGAMVGSLMSNGSIGLSAALGAGIGFPAGILASLAADSLMNYRVSESRKEYSSEIADNQEEIANNNVQIEEFRRQVDEEVPAANPPTRNRTKLYDGATYGNMYR